MQDARDTRSKIRSRISVINPVALLGSVMLRNRMIPQYYGLSQDLNGAMEMRWCFLQTALKSGAVLHSALFNVDRHL